MGFRYYSPGPRRAVKKSTQRLPRADRLKDKSLREHYLAGATKVARKKPENLGHALRIIGADRRFAVEVFHEVVKTEHPDFSPAKVNRMAEFLVRKEYDQIDIEL